MWEREEKKIPYKCGGHSLIGALGTPPFSHGNYFYLKHKGEPIRVGNMWLENLEHALEHFLEDKLVNIVIYRENNNSWCLIHDERIPENYYVKKLCWTGSSPPSIDILKDMYKTREELEKEKDWKIKT